ncbi:spermidine/putrescine ABC transporter substrate-binding protein PotF, partial [Acinetobacter baumannii]
ASLTNKVFYANPNAAARKLVKPEIANDPAVYPPEADMKNMVLPDAVNNDIRRQMTRIYTSFKTGL